MKSRDSVDGRVFTGAYRFGSPVYGCGCRYHLVSIVAVFLALAIGIVLGSTELQGPTYSLLNYTTAALQNELAQVSSQRDTAQQQAAAGEAYAGPVQPVVLRGLLAGQRLLIITEPGAAASAVTAISAAATAGAGATVTGQIALQPKFFDSSGTSQDSLDQVTMAMARAGGIALDAPATSQQQAAQVLASEILTTSSGPSAGQASDQPGTNAQTMLAAYEQSGFLSISGQPATQATLAVIVTSQTAPADGSSDPLGQLLVPLAQELAAKSAATVVAGSSAGSGPGSPIAVLQSSNTASQVSTVDDADLVAGQSAVIQALATQLNGGKSGSYGIAANGASAVGPSPAPTPSATPGPATSKAGKANECRRRVEAVSGSARQGAWSESHGLASQRAAGARHYRDRAGVRRSTAHRHVRDLYQNHHGRRYTGD
jgi:Copper transport outer membrane protein, MctB